MEKCSNVGEKAPATRDGDIYPPLGLVSGVARELPPLRRPICVAPHEALAICPPKVRRINQEGGTDVEGFRDGTDNGAVCGDNVFE